jgi:hypothetical protein
MAFLVQGLGRKLTQRRLLIIASLFTEFDELKIWDDRRIDPTAALTDELRNKVERACLLLIVMSPRYLASAWCTGLPSRLWPWAPISVGPLPSK